MKVNNNTRNVGPKSTSYYFRCLSTFSHSASKPLLITFSFYDLLNKTKFISSISNKLEKGNLYLVLLKVRYNTSLYYMAGRQFGFNYKDGVDKYLSSLFDNTISSINRLFEVYNINDDEIVYFQFSFRKIDSKFISDLSIDKDKSELTLKDKKMLSQQVKLFPLISDPSVLGKPIKDLTIDNNTVTSLKIESEGDTIDIIESIKDQEEILNLTRKDVIKTEFNSDYNFYLRDNVKPPHILAVKAINDNSIQKEVYTLDGVKVDSVVDEVINNELVKRRVKNKSLEISNNHITYVEEPITLDPIMKEKVLKNRKPRSIENPNIGVIDLETYVNTKSQTGKVYAAGLFSYVNKTPVTFYINKDTLDSNKVIYDLIDEMFKYKYKDIKFYCHNLSGFDSVFIMKALLEHKSDTLKYQLNIIFRKNDVLKLEITKIIKCANGATKKNKISIVDSYAILTDSLLNLTKKYEVSTIKGNFPHSFASENTLFYIGNTPDIKHYGNISPVDYNSQNNWSFKDESIKYLNCDLIGLYEVLTKANQQIFLLFDVQMTGCLTISKIALEIFMKHHYTNNNIPLITNKKLYSDIKAAYYGGITEVYKPYGENLYYYDVNSLYPFVALSDMPGTTCIRKEFINKNVNINDLFGYFFCEIESPTPLGVNYLGLLPVRTKQGLIFPNGKWNGWYFSEELKYASENGYRIKVIKGYEFNRVKDLFKSYVETLYKYKSSDNSTVKGISKLLLNSLLGRFGLDIEKNVTKLVDNLTLQEIAVTRQISSEKQITEEYSLVSYNPDIDYDICKTFDIDIVKVVDRPSSLNVNIDSQIDYDSVSIAIAAAVTAYGRIHINKIKNEILKLNGKIYYSDTDSIVSSVELPKDLIDPKLLGKLKIEHFVNKGYFISSKTYCLNTKDNNGEDKTIIKAKGVEKTSLTVKDFENMLKGEIIETSFKVGSEKDYSKGSVIISNIPVKINPNNYVKRDKIFDNNNKWIDTKPLIYSNLDEFTLKALDNSLNVTVWIKPILNLIVYIKPKYELITYIYKKLNFIIVNPLLPPLGSLLNNFNILGQTINFNNTNTNNTNSANYNINKDIFDKLNTLIFSIENIRKQINSLNIFEKYTVELKGKINTLNDNFIKTLNFLYTSLLFVVVLGLYLLSFILVEKETETVIEEASINNPLPIEEDYINNKEDLNVELNTLNKDLDISENIDNPLDTYTYESIESLEDEVNDLDVKFEEIKRLLWESLDQVQEKPTTTLYENFKNISFDNKPEKVSVDSNNIEGKVKEIRTGSINWSPNSPYSPNFVHDDTLKQNERSEIKYPISPPLSPLSKPEDIAGEVGIIEETIYTNMPEEPKDKTRPVIDTSKSKYADWEKHVREQNIEYKRRWEGYLETKYGISPKSEEEWLKELRKEENPEYSPNSIREMENRLKEIDMTLLSLNIEGSPIDRPSIGYATNKLLDEKIWLEDEIKKSNSEKN